MGLSNLVHQPSYLHFDSKQPLPTVYSERQKYGINSLKIKQIFFQKIVWTGQF
jgi:hypothetical protein